LHWAAQKAAQPFSPSFRFYTASQFPTTRLPRGTKPLNHPRAAVGRVGRIALSLRKIRDMGNAATFDSVCVEKERFGA
jgi:hypothetical protein